MEDYTNFTKKELIEEIESLKRLNKELLNTFHDTENMEFGWDGNLGQWFWDFTLNEVTYNPLKATALGYTKEELPEKVPYEFFTEKLHPEDYEFVMQEMQDHLDGEIPVWEVKYRIQAKDGSWKIYQDRGKVTERTEEGKPLFLKGIVFDITEEEQEKQRLKVANDELKTRMERDTLTSLYGRQATLFELTKLKDREKPQSIILLRIDDYARYEEAVGVVLSESLLKTTAKIIKDIVGEEYFAGRFRETVFMIVLDGEDQEEAYKIAEAIREQVLNTVFEISGIITVSAGVADYKPGETIGQLVSKVNKKLMEAQRQGGNKVIK